MNFQGDNFQSCECASGSSSEPEPSISGAISISCEWNCSLPSVSYCWWSFSSAISHLQQSVTLPACSPYDNPCIPAVVLYCWMFQGTVRLKIFYFLCLSFMYYLCEKYYRPITVQYYTGDFEGWVPKLTLLDLQMCSQIGTCLFVGVFLYLSFLLKLAPQFIGCWTVSVWTYVWLYLNNINIWVVPLETLI